MTLTRGGWILLLAAACAAAEHDAADVLARFGATIRENASRMPKTMCAETIERQYYRAKLTRTPRDCDELAAEKKRRGYKLTLESSDRVRLDVRAGAGAEMYSWPGAERFEGHNLWDLIGYGPGAGGPFGMLPLEVVQGDATDFAFLGETEAGGRKLFQYSFRVPQERSHYFTRAANEDIATAWDGTVLIDAETSELARLTTRTSELPREAFGCGIETISEYGRDPLLARETRQRFIDRSGAEVENVVTFSGCREAPALRPPPAPARSLDLPPGLAVDIELTTRIDSATAAAGDRFTGKVSTPVRDASNHVLLQKGTAAAGRLTKVAFHAQPREVAIVLHVETVDIDGVEAPIHLTGRFHPKRGWLLEMLTTMHVGGLTVIDHPPAPEGETDALSFPGAGKVLEPGFATEWITVGP